MLGDIMLCYCLVYCLIDCYVNKMNIIGKVEKFIVYVNCDLYYVNFSLYVL